ncbi:hypothetical protein GHO25_00170 [Pseudomonas sp. FSL R10-1350]|uniref:hypothetical protein n=1 Tax=Pseudomonas sp. FSL R10-1350 TaxID=2662197 RepID=UPI001295520B|nr:hypothetical protein [Pseudomonas sp. FSL R10-1350]MQU61548.1 hypothetical protein [Pseudomonas sp. FSL R10-1350]
MSMDKLAQLYIEAGIDVELDEVHITLTIDGFKFRAELDSDWVKSIDTYFKSKQYTFDSERRLLMSNSTIEVELVRIDPSFAARPDHEYSDSKDNTVIISTASPEFILSYMGSKIEPNPIAMVKRRLLRRAKTRKSKPGAISTLYRFEEILISPVTAEYAANKKIDKALLRDRGMGAIKSSLFKLSLTLGECWELKETMPSMRSVAPVKPEEPDTTIPAAVYHDDLVKFYKVARSSVFPSQQFLSFYHILEYNFLRVSDEILHTSIKSMINSPEFNASYQNVNKLIATLKKNDSSSDETEMLKSVLKKYVDEDDLIEHIRGLEKSKGYAIYTDTKTKIFGEQAFIKNEKGHALTNTAKVVKQLRNALVHSSDRYNREECFLPLSSSENVILEYIPILRFLAEKVIFATAEV